jgi:hypothetical protein
MSGIKTTKHQGREFVSLAWQTKSLKEAVQILLKFINKAMHP